MNAVHNRDGGGFVHRLLLASGVVCVHGSWSRRCTECWPPLIALPGGKPWRRRRRTVQQRQVKLGGGGAA